jgi:hypothetical protein
MASTVRLPAKVLQSIASQIAERLPQTAALLAPGAAAPALGESLKVDVLPWEAISQGRGPLAARLEPTYQWHHQIYQGRQAVSFARTTAEGLGRNAPHHVQEVAQSTLPQAVQQTIAWIDKNVGGDAKASLVVAPDFFLTAVWLHGPQLDAVVIAEMADGLKGLSPNQLIPSDEFLGRLAQNPPVEGLGGLPATI